MKTNAFASQRPPPAWSRRITDEHRLVYKIGGDAVRIAACHYHYG